MAMVIARDILQLQIADFTIKQVGGEICW